MLLSLKEGWLMVFPLGCASSLECFAPVLLQARKKKVKMIEVTIMGKNHNTNSNGNENGVQHQGSPGQKVTMLLTISHLVSPLAM